jgi:hypothetical protein
MAVFRVNSTNSPFTVPNLNNLGGQQEQPEFIVIASGGGLAVNLPSLSALSGYPQVTVLCVDGDVTVNSNGTDLLSSDSAVGSNVALGTGNSAIFKANTGFSSELANEYWSY